MFIDALSDEAMTELLERRPTSKVPAVTSHLSLPTHPEEDGTGTCVGTRTARHAAGGGSLPRSSFPLALSGSAGMASMCAGTM